MAVFIVLVFITSTFVFFLKLGQYPVGPVIGSTDWLPPDEEQVPGHSGHKLTNPEKNTGERKHKASL